MNGSVPDPVWFDADVSETNSGCPDAEFGDRVAVAPLTAALGTHGEDFAALASTTHGDVELHLPPADVASADVQVVVVQDFPLADALGVQVVVLQEFPPADALDEQLVVVHVCPPDEALVAHDAVVVQACPPEDPLDVQFEGGLPPPVVPPGGGEDVVPGDPGGVDDELQPVCAGFVLPIPWLPSHS